MRRATIFPFLLLLAAAPPPCGAQTHAQSQSRSRGSVNPDRLSMTCAQILQMTSSDWIAKIGSMDDSSQDGQLRGIRVYGECYDERTDRLAASLAKTRQRPPTDARANFRDFEAALKDFTAKALAATDPPADAVKSAYAALYEKQFRYAFYQAYEQKAAKPGSPPSSARVATKAPVEAAATPSAPPSSLPPAGTKPAANNIDPLTKAKNRFGELLGALSEDKIHEVHAAFGNIMGLHPVDSATELAVYGYAIFVLEPLAPRPDSLPHRPPAKPFSPPPF